MKCQRCGETEQVFDFRVILKHTLFGDRLAFPKNKTARMCRECILDLDGILIQWGLETIQQHSSKNPSHPTDEDMGI